MKTRPNSAVLLFFGLLSALLAPSWGNPEETKSTQAVTMELGSMWLLNVVGDMSVLSLGYERHLSGTSYSFKVQLHGGYDANGDNLNYGDTSWAAGGGLTLRRYFGDAFQGAFGQAQFDYVRGEDIYLGYSEWINGSLIPGKRTVDENSYLAPQLSFGYKWQNEFFLVEGAVGGAVYLTPSEKFTSLSASFNVGAPF